MVISRCHFLARYSKTPAQTLICSIGRYLFVVICPGQRSQPPRRPKLATCVSAYGSLFISSSGMQLVICPTRLAGGREDRSFASGVRVAPRHHALRPCASNYDFLRSRSLGGSALSSSQATQCYEPSRNGRLWNVRCWGVTHLHANIKRRL